MNISRGIILFASLTLWFGATVGIAADLTARYYVVPTTNLKLLDPQNAAPVIATKAGLNLVRLSPPQVRQLSQKLHGGYSICGGFLDVQVQMETKGWTPQMALSWAASRPMRLARFDKMGPTYPQQVGKVLGLLSGPRYDQFLKELTAFPDRYAAADTGVKAAQWLAEKVAQVAKSHGRDEIMVRLIPTGQSYPQNSVLVRIPGQDASLPGVLVGGHMDTYSNGKPGADDDGTGSATVMEVYNAVLDSGLHFKRDLYFAFYAAEEWGLYGSQKVANEFQQRHIPMRSILQFDMTGFKSPDDPQEIYFINDHVDMNLTRFLKQLTETYLKIPVNLMGDTQCGYSCSDHASWTNAGYAAAFPFEASMQNYNRSLHTGRDTLSLLTPLHELKYLKLGAAFAVETADPN